MPLIPKAFVFARHAQSTFNACQKVGGSTNSPLSTLGKQQAQSAATLLNKPWSEVCTSHLNRTIHTAKLAVPCQAPTPYEGLGERDWGDLEGTPIPSTTDYFATPKNGEPWDEFYLRILSTTNQILEGHDLPLIIAHSGVYRALHHALFNTPNGPRIGNIEPMLFQPINPHTNQWKITPYKGHRL